MPRPVMGRWPGAVLYAPWSGLGEHAWFSVLFYLDAAGPSSSDATLRRHRGLLMALAPNKPTRSVAERSLVDWFPKIPVWIKLLLGGSLVFALGLLAGFQAGSFVDRKPTNSEAKLPLANEIDDFDKAIQGARTSIDKGNFKAAHDLILAASLSRPRSGELIDAVLDFIEKAATSESEEDHILAEDLLSRRDGLVAYQPVAEIHAARQRFEDAAKRFTAKFPPLPPATSDPLKSVKELAEHANNGELSVEIRLRACDAARTAISEWQFAVATNPADQANPDVLQQLNEIEVHIEKSEQQCNLVAFRPVAQKADAWLVTSKKLLDEINSPKQGKRDSAKVEQLKGQIRSGGDLLVELSAYTKFGVDAAAPALRKVESSLEASQRAIGWAYNIEILTLVRELERDKKMTADQKVRLLAVVKEEELAPEILQRHNALWEKTYGELKGEEEQVQAIRMRILRTNK